MSRFIVFFILFSSIFFAKAQLTVKIYGVKNSNGKILIALYNSESSFMKESKAIQSAKVEVVEKKSQATFKSLKAGYYAISLFHDENDNEELDTNFLGIPKEDYGFSNNARGTFGPPTYSESKFYYNGKSKTITIQVK